MKGEALVALQYEADMAEAKAKIHALQQRVLVLEEALATLGRALPSEGPTSVRVYTVEPPEVVLAEVPNGEV